MAARKKDKQEAGAEAVKPAADETVTSVKGFDLNWRCRGHQFEIGKTYEVTGKIVACKHGFHAVDYPLDAFAYYPPGISRYAEVTQSGALGRHAADTKIASAKITIGAELHIHELIQRAVKWVFDRAVPSKESHSTGDHGAASSTGDLGAASSTGFRGAASSTGFQGAASSTGFQGAASSTGFRGAASSTGDQGAASSTGFRGAASSTGDQGAASSTGFRGAASSTGFQGAASSTGFRGAASSTGKFGCAMSAGHLGRAMGAEGNALFLVRRNSNTGQILHAWAGIVGRDGIKPLTWYELADDGQPRELGAA